MGVMRCTRLSRRWICWAILSGLLLVDVGVAAASQASGAAAATIADDRDTMVLERAVIVMRHGPRTPRATSEWTSLNSKQWPSWSLPDGELTAHGYAAMVLLGGYFAQTLGPLREDVAHGCGPSDRSVFVFASKSSRTQHSARAFLHGWMPQCPAYPIHIDKKRDIYFRMSSSRAALDPVSDKAAILATLGKDWRGAQAQHQIAIREFEDVVGVRGDCVASRVNLPCRFSEIPWIYDTAYGVAHLYALNSMSETIRMHYVNRLPLEQVAWGYPTDLASMRKWLQPRLLYFAMVKSSPHRVARRGSAMLQAVLDHLNTASNDAQPSSTPRLVLFSGHDTNIVELRALLRFDWELPGGFVNDINPGASLVFERWRRRRDGARAVRVTFVSPTIDQLRDLTPLSLHAPPYRAAWQPLQSGVSDNGDWPDVWTSLEAFTTTMLSRIDPTAVSPVDYGEPVWMTLSPALNSPTVGEGSFVPVPASAPASAPVSVFVTKGLQ